MTQEDLFREFNLGFINMKPGTRLLINGNQYIKMKCCSSIPTEQALFCCKYGTIHHAIEFFSSWLGFENVKKRII